VGSTAPTVPTRLIRAGRDFSYDGRVIPVTSPRTMTADALHTRRVDAEARLVDAALPDTDEEVWRYSRVAELDLQRWSSPEPSSEVPAAVDRLLGTLGHLAGAVVVHDGSVVAARLDEHLVAAGVFVGRAVDHPEGVDALGSVIGVGPDVFTTRNDARSTEPLFVHVPRGVVVDAPIVIVDWISSADVAVHPRLVVRMGENAEATVVEWRGSEDVAALSIPVMELRRGPCRPPPTRRRAGSRSAGLGAGHGVGPRGRRWVGLGGAGRSRL